MPPENENTLHITLTGDQSDLDFIRERCLGACQDVIDEYEHNLDGQVEVDWNWER